MIIDQRASPHPTKKSGNVSNITTSLFKKRNIGSNFSALADEEI